MKITKAHEGKTIYGVPTGNNARRGVDKQKPVVFEVVSVARKYAELKCGTYTDHYCISTGGDKSSIQAGYTGSGGYTFFESLPDIELYHERREMLKNLSAEFSWHGCSNLTYDQVKRIHDIVSEAKS